jgi:hypothetical protein
MTSVDSVVDGIMLGMQVGRRLCDGNESWTDEKEGRVIQRTKHTRSRAKRAESTRICTCVLRRNLWITTEKMASGNSVKSRRILKHISFESGILEREN